MPNIYWICGLTGFLIIFAVIGGVTGKNLPPKKRGLRFQKFVLAGVMPFVIYVFSAIPFVTPDRISRPSSVYNTEIEPPQNSTSVEENTKYLKNYYYRIERLETEVQDIREQLYNTHQHYRFILQFLMSGFLSYAFVRIFTNVSDEDSENRNTLGDKNLK